MMDASRFPQTEDYGILRKKEGKDEELFVFGYSCKIYEDYHKSLYVDQGKHLIPWLGDDSLKIDRYDCRGALNDLTAYLPKSEGFDRFVGLSNEEKRIESLCDQERFRALTVNEDEEILYQEEEFKRLQKALSNEKSYSEVAFSYDEDSKPASEISNKDSVEDDEDQFESFIPPYQLDVPVGMKLPKSRKHHEIIEKTAFFISEQGAQMEILLKMKQADNPQFNFLSFDNELHAYYRHMMNAIKNGRYKQSTIPEDGRDSDTSKSELASENTYLHPSLLPSATTISSSVPVSVPHGRTGALWRKSMHRCLIENTYFNFCSASEVDRHFSFCRAPSIPTISYKPSNDCSYSALVNRIKETQSASRDLSALTNVAANQPTLSPYLASANNAQSGDSNDDAKQLQSLDGLSKSARRRRARKEKEKSKVAVSSSYKIYYSEEPMDDDDDKRSEAKDVAELDGDTSPQLKPIPAPAVVLQIPSPDVQLIIDKMASYVVKNGRDFEAVVKAKGDPRFSFLEREHVYNPFYCQKVELYSQLENAQMKSSSTCKTSKLQKPDSNHAPPRRTSAKVTKSSRSNKPVPICFSIKKPKEEELAVRSALPYEESEGEIEGESEQDGVTCQAAEANEQSSNVPMQIDVHDSASSKLDRPEHVEANSKPSETTLEKWAQERLVAKLVTAAKEKLAARDRDKLAAKNKDKQLQAERRRRAAEFINLIQKERENRPAGSADVSENVSNGRKETSTADVITILSSSASDSDSIVSLPSSGYDKKESKTQIDRKTRTSSERSVSRLKKKGRASDVDSEHRRKKLRDHRSGSSSRTRSRSHSHSRHSGKYKKRDREKSRSKKSKHHHHRHQSSPSLAHKRSRKSAHKSKRSRYSNDSDSDSSNRSSTMSTTKST